MSWRTTSSTRPSWTSGSRRLGVFNQLLRIGIGAGLPRGVAPRANACAQRPSQAIVGAFEIGVRGNEGLVAGGVKRARPALAHAGSERVVNPLRWSAGAGSTTITCLIGTARERAKTFPPLSVHGLTTRWRRWRPPPRIHFRGRTARRPDIASDHPHSFAEAFAARAHVSVRNIERTMTAVIESGSGVTIVRPLGRPGFERLVGVGQQRDRVVGVAARPRDRR